MKRLSLLFLLALPALVAWAAGAEMRVVRAGGVSVAPNVIGPFPADGVYTYQPDPRCGPASNVLPDLPTAICMRSRAVEYLVREVQAGRVKPGPKFAACSYPSDPAWPACIEYTLRNATPEIRWGQSPVWVKGAVEGVPWEGCAAGVSYGPFIRVSFADPARTQKLVAHETTNVLLTTIDRYTATDGPITTDAVNYALAHCGI